MDSGLFGAIRNKLYNFLWPVIEDLFTISEPIQIHLIDINNNLNIIPFDESYSKKVIKYMKRHLKVNKILSNDETMEIKIQNDEVKFICKNCSFKEFSKIKNDLKKSINKIMHDITVHHTCRLNTYGKHTLYVVLKI